MPCRAKITLDSAMALCQGQRARQEDCIATHFPTGGPLGFAVLADGMGGHAAGDVASKLAVSEVFAELTHWSADPSELEQKLREVFQTTLHNANAAIAEYAATEPDHDDLGTTLLVPVVISARMYWLSVGDSPLFLIRQNRLHRLNTEHSLAAHLDRQVARGELSPPAALAHPDRQCLTSVLTGTPVPEVDARLAPFALMPGDVIIAATDGLHGLGQQKLCALLREGKNRDARGLCADLLDALKSSTTPEQDNTALCVIKVLPDVQSNAQPGAASSPPALRPTRRKVTFLASGRASTGIRCTHALEEFPG